MYLETFLSIYPQNTYMTNNEVSNDEKESDWEFDVPKFWDLSESTRQNRPSDDWFRQENISAASFGAPKKPKQTNIFKQHTGGVKHVNAKVSHKSSMTTTTTNDQAQQPQQPSVFDRLSRESTISFSRKTNQPLAAQQTQHLKSRHESPKELNTESSKQTVGERVAMLEKTHQIKNPATAVEKKKIQAKPAIDKLNTTKSTSRPIPPPAAPPRPPSQPKTLSEEMQQSGNKTQIIDKSPPTKSKISSHPSRIIALSKQSIAAASIRKPIAPTETKKLEEKRIAAVKKYFVHLLEQNNTRKEKRLKQRLSKYFDGLIKRSKKIHNERQKEVKTTIRPPSPIRPTATSTTIIALTTKTALTSPATTPITSQNRFTFSPRKRTMSMVGARYAVENIKKARIEVEKAKELTGEYKPLSASDRARMTSQISNTPQQ